jgi:hypothetical protein
VLWHLKAPQRWAHSLIKRTGYIPRYHLDAGALQPADEQIPLQARHARR